MTFSTDERQFDDDVLADLVADVTEEFIERIERGESPDVEDYARKHPTIADILRNMLPALVAMKADAAGDCLSGADDVSTGSRQSAGGDVDVAGELGDFRIIREIGRGGMGVVYEAEQQSLRRRVALKVLPFAAAMDSRRLERFRNEATAAARLHHAHIVPVHSVGSERGVYYYAMQMIEGETLADVIRNLRRTEQRAHRDDAISGAETSSHVVSLVNRSARSADDFRRTRSTKHDSVASVQEESPPTDTETAAAALTNPQETQTPSYIRFAVELAIQAAEAMDHAHSFDIVHRDIKPANLMIDHRGHLWITDFGLARIRTETGVTVSGDFVGTFLYSSPEQVLGHAGAVDSRSDIYSLGATLYELLTLEPVVRSLSREKIIHEIATEEPVAPRKHNPAIKIDLETVLLKCLHKDPSLRYQTARDLADDLRRFLDDRPILARRPTLLQRSTRWMRRHTAIVTSSMLVLFVAVVALGISTAMIAREQQLTSAAYDKLEIEQAATQVALDAERAALDAEREALDAEREARAAEQQQRLMYERNLAQARDMLQFFMNIAEEDLAGNADLQEIRIRMLQSSLDYYQDFIEQSADNPPLQAELADAHMHSARILYRIGSTPDALAALESALQTQEQLVRESPDDRSRLRRLSSMYFQLGVFSGRNKLMLAGQSSIQEHLGIAHEQHEAINDLIAAQTNPRKLFDDQLDMTSARRQFQKETERLNEELDELLDAAQTARLEQISLQERGTRAFSDLQVAAQLGLSATQREEIRRIEKDGFEQMRKLFHERRHDEARKQIGLIRELVLEVLEPAQQQLWNEMTGEPFTGRIHHWWNHGKSRKRDDEGRRRKSEPRPAAD